MSKRLPLILLLLNVSVVLRGDLAGQSQWRRVIADLGSNVTDGFLLDMVASDGTWVAARGAHILLSWDAGQAWTESSVDVPVDSAILDLFVDHETVMAAAGFDGLLRSTDRGRSFHRSSQGLPRDLYVGVVGGTAATMLAGTGNGVYRSTDEGMTWKRSDRGMPNGSLVLGFTRIGKSIIAAIRDGVYSYGIYRSTDEGKTWRRTTAGIGLGLTGERVVGRFWIAEGFSLSAKGIVGSGDTLILSMFQPTATEVDTLALDGSTPVWTPIYYSTDMGKTWTPVSLSKAVEPYCYVCSRGQLFHTNHGGDFLVQMGIGIARSTDQGATWSPFNDGLPPPDDDLNETPDPRRPLVQSIFEEGASIYAVGSNGDIWKYPIAGLSR